MSLGLERIGGVVQRELERFGPAGAMREIVAAWPDAVGEPIARNAWPARVGRDGTLHVATSSSAWAFELTQCAGTILQRLEKRLGDRAPGALRFVAGPLPARGPEPVETSRRSVPEVRAEHVAEGQKVAAEIGDSELRELVARAVAASAAVAARGVANRPV